MFTDQFIHDLGSYMEHQGERLLERQKSSFGETYESRSGSLARALSARPVIKTSGNSVSVEVSYPIHIRFLDMKKRWSKKNQKMVRKKKYAPIYNKYVYGYLKSDIHRKLNELIPRVMIWAIDGNIKTVK